MSDRLAADSPLLLLDVDVVNSIAFVLSQLCCITLRGVRDIAAIAMAAVPTIAEITWPDTGGHDWEDTMVDDDLQLGDINAVLQLGDPLNDGFVLGLGGDLDDDDLGL